MKYKLDLTKSNLYFIVYGLIVELLRKHHIGLVTLSISLYCLIHQIWQSLPVTYAPNLAPSQTKVSIPKPSTCLY